MHFVDTTNYHVWESREPELLRYMIGLYDIPIDAEEYRFRRALAVYHKNISEAFGKMPKELGSVFQELTLFSPEPTGSIEEEKAYEKKYDSLVSFLKENGKKVDYGKLFNAGLNIIASFVEDTVWLNAVLQKPKNILGVRGSVLHYERTDFGDLVVGDTGANTYETDFAIIIDLGGDDQYNVGATRRNLKIIFDKSGNDQYHGENYSIACGYFGISLLIDEKGDDLYEAGNYSIGCGIFGIGMLIDKDGDDRYIGDTYTQGAGGFGIGVLKDYAGNDIYEAALCSQGFASSYGIGVLADNKGNDMYLVQEKYLDEIRYLDHYLSFSQGFSIGFRPEISAGIGLLFEKDGNDYYLVDIFGQASSYWYGFGAILDENGNDTYVGYQYVQGVGTHITIGLLLDKRGNDNYVAKGVSQGCGHDLSFGLLWDFEGNDSYVAYDLSQGAGNANGVGILIDEIGDDTYSVKVVDNTQGYGDFRNEYGSIGILLDIKGSDSYSSGQDKLLWSKGKYGIGIDWD